MLLLLLLLEYTNNELRELLAISYGMYQIKVEAAAAAAAIAVLPYEYTYDMQKLAKPGLRTYNERLECMNGRTDGRTDRQTDRRIWDSWDLIFICTYKQHMYNKASRDWVTDAERCDDFGQFSLTCLRSDQQCSFLAARVREFERNPRDSYCYYYYCSRSLLFPCKSSDHAEIIIMRLENVFPFSSVRPSVRPSTRLLRSTKTI